MMRNMVGWIFIVLYISSTYAQLQEFSSITHAFAQACTAEQTGNIALASELYTQFVAQYPSCTQAWYNLAHTLKDLNRIDDAIQIYQKVLTLDPEHIFARFGLGQCYGSLQEYEKAFPLLELRGSAIKEFARDIEFLKNKYSSKESLQGLRILLRAEWGLGDNIQFIRYAQLLHDRGAHIIMHSYPELQPLFRLCPYIDQVISAGDGFPAHQLQIPLLSLPYVCSITKETCTPTMPYLKVHSDLTVQWRSYLDLYQTFNIGICWQGKGDAHAPPLLNKNIPFNALAPLSALAEVSIFNLQKNCSEDIDLPHLIQFDSSFDQKQGRFMDTAALMHSLDLIITIDTSIAHLAGALNRPVWLLLPYHSDWRWGAEGSTCPFYPSMRLFRQKNPGDWKGVMEEVVIALKEIKKGSVSKKN